MGNDKPFQRKKLRAEARLQREEEEGFSTLNILIIGEGTTEYNYFNDMRRNLRGVRINLILVKSKGSAPISVVDTALDYCEKNEDIDYAFCVFDRDEHQSFDEALDKLRRYQPSVPAKSKPKFKVITSNPCFEIWPLIHFTYTTKSYSRSGSKSPCDNLHDDLSREFVGYSKTMTNLFSELNSKLETALTHAKRLSKNNFDTGSTNPSTKVNELVNFIREEVKKLSK